MFVGGTPGREEEMAGEPYVGRHGQLLTKMIQAMGYSRDSVYITLAAKCRGSGDSGPDADAAVCRPFLEREICLVRPKAIVAMGAEAARALTGGGVPPDGERCGFEDYSGIPVMCVQAPEYLDRNPASKKPAWERLQQVMALLKA
jgi:DNA polymerase